MSECRYISTVMQWNGILIEYTTIRNNEELIKFTMRNLVGLDDHTLIHLFLNYALSSAPLIPRSLISPDSLWF